MGLNFPDRSGLTFVNINKQGKLYIKAEDGSFKYPRSLSGIVKKVGFTTFTHEGRTSETAKILMEDNGDMFQLEMYTESGYFLSFCNFLKTADVKSQIEVSPSAKLNDKGKTVRTCFVKQNNTALKQAYTLANMGELPPLEKVEGQTYLDSSKQVAFWKDWLIKTFGLIQASAVNAASNTSSSSGDDVAPADITEPLQDLPF